jgi:hypothetical protein
MRGYRARKEEDSLETSRSRDAVAGELLSQGLGIERNTIGRRDGSASGSPWQTP